MFDWTIMIYFGGDNNLSEEMVWAIKDIQAWRRSADHAKNVKVCALFDAGGPPVPFDDDMLAMYTADAFKGKAPGHQNAPVNGASLAPLLKETVAVREDADQAKATKKRPDKVVSVQETLAHFIAMVFKEFEAQHYMLVLSGHGSGAVGDFLTGDKRISGLTIPGLGQVLDQVKEKHGTKKKPKPIDILGMDSCQMSMAEVACQVRDAVQLMVGAEGFEPNTGWPYANVLGLLTNATIANDAGEFAEGIVRTHVDYYLDYASADLSTDIAAMNLDYYDDFQRALQELTHALGFSRQTEEQFEAVQKLPAEKLSAELKKRVSKTTLAYPEVVDAIVLAHWKSQGYKREQYVDLWDFCDQLSRRLKGIKNPEIKKVYEACEALKEVIEPEHSKPKDARFIRLSAYSGPQFQHSHGISVYFPWASLTDAAGITDLECYQDLRFAQETAWDELIRLYLYSTQREVRETNTTGEILPSLLNRRTGLFIPQPGRDPEDDPYSRTRLGVGKIDNMKNPPIQWKQWFVAPAVGKAHKKAAT